MRRQRGMTLLETLVVVAIAAAVIGGIIFKLQSQQTQARREDAVRVQGLEMSNLAAAARQYAETAGETWAEGTRHEVTITELVDAGLLPEGFGARGASGTLGQTPLGQLYRVFSIKDGAAPYEDPDVENGTVRTVIVDLGTPIVGRMERAGISTSAVEALLVFKEAVALYAATEERLPMGVIPAGGGEVRGVGRSFTKDVIDWIENNAGQDAVVALVGFPDLEGGGETGPVGGGLSYCEDVVFVEERLNPTCPAGYLELAREKICTAPAPIFSGSEYGAVVMGTENTQTRSPAVALNYTYTPLSGNPIQGSLLCGATNSNRAVSFAKLNGVTVGTFDCLYTYSATTVTYTGGFTPPICTSATNTSTSHPSLSQPDARSLVCCLPNTR